MCSAAMQRLLDLDMNEVVREIEAMGPAERQRLSDQLDWVEVVLNYLCTNP